MYHQSTARPPRPAARFRHWPLLLFVAPLLGAAVGLMVYAFSQSPFPGAAGPSPYSVPLRLTIGAHGSFGTDTMVWVDDSGRSAFNRAYANRDERAMLAALRIWDTFTIPVGTALKITDRRGDAVQVEVLGAPYLGRRGWTDATVRFVHQP